MSPSRTVSAHRTPTSRPSVPLRSRTRCPALVPALCATTLALTGLAAAPPAQVPTAAVALPYQDPSLPVPQRVTDLLSRMTLDDKLGQLTSSPAERRGIPAVARWGSCFTDDRPVREDSR
ncbi:hypothetical protein QF037_009229 [Streptomyces canus]|nr:hypothetical protein [Streptomyces canus]